LKGSILLLLEDYDNAISAYKKAYTLQKEYSAFRGLVDSYLSKSMLREATFVAKEAFRLMPRSPRVFTLMGLVFSHSTNPTAREKARKAFESSLKEDNSNTETVIALVELNVMEERIQDAINLLQKYSDQVKRKEFVYTRLAELQTYQKDYPSALTNYHLALGTNADFTPAKEGLTRLEKLLEGNQEGTDEVGDLEELAEDDNELVAENNAELDEQPVQDEVQPPADEEATYPYTTQWV